MQVTQIQQVTPNPRPGRFSTQTPLERERRLQIQREQRRLSIIYKMCHGLLDGDWGDYLITSKERRTRGSHDFKFIVPIFLDFLFFPGQ